VSGSVCCEIVGVIANHADNTTSNNLQPDRIKVDYLLIKKSKTKIMNYQYKLTKTQQIILEEIADGKTAVQIAKERNVSENTVYTHVKAIYQELDVHTRTEAVKKAYEIDLLKWGK
jgi:two-component system, NarL family, response regulator YdfI